MLELIALVVAGVAGVGGYMKSRSFTRERLRFVDVAQSKVAPVVAGGVAALAAAPVVWILPVVGAGTAVLFGVGVGAGVRRGAREIHQQLPSGF